MPNEKQPEELKPADPPDPIGTYADEVNKRREARAKAAGIPALILESRKPVEVQRQERDRRVAERLAKNAEEAAAAEAKPSVAP